MALKAVGVLIPRKAILTKENKNWPFATLMSQVGQEHEQLAMAAQEGEDSAAGSKENALEESES